MGAAEPPGPSRLRAAWWSARPITLSLMVFLAAALFFLPSQFPYGSLRRELIATLARAEFEQPERTEAFAPRRRVELVPDLPALARHLEEMRFPRIRRRE